MMAFCILSISRVTSAVSGAFTISVIFSAGTFPPASNNLAVVPAISGLLSLAEAYFSFISLMALSPMPFR